jgi:hypothetical protein
MMVAAGICFIVVTLTEAHGGWFGSSKKEKEEVQQPTNEASQPQKAAEKPKVDKTKEDAAIKARQIAAQKKSSELNNTEWQIELTPLSGKGKKELETIDFKNSQISFVSYAKKGFPATNFTLTIQEGGAVVWETMQTSEKSGIAFWRGEMDNNMQLIRGILSYQIDQKTKQDYSFVSVSKKNIPAPGN